MLLRDAAPAAAIGALAVFGALAAAACSPGSTAGSDEGLDPAAAAAAASQPPGDVAASQPEAGAAAAQGGDAEDAPVDPLSIQGEIIGDYNLNDGDCFNRIEDLRAGRKVVITARLDCDAPHTYEVFHTFDLDAPHPSTYPGDTAIYDYSRKLCYEQFEAFVGRIYELSVYEIGVFTPDRANFEHDVARYRRVHCWLYRSDLQQVRGSARGSAE